MSAVAGRAAGSELVFGDGRPASLGDQRQFELIAQLAGFWARPVAFVDPSYLTIGPLAAKSVVAMDQTAQFRAPINASVSDALGLDRKTPDAVFLQHVATSAANRLVILLLTAPLATLHRVGLALAAAILSRRISGLVMKADRMRARAALGEEAFQIAVEEAPLMYASLSDLDLKVQGVGLLDGSAAKGIEMVAFARAVLGRLCDAIVPSLTDVLALRFPVDPSFDGRARLLGSFTSAQIDLALRMIRRKEASWLATIA